MTQQASDLLLKAVDVIHERGHAKGDYVDNEGRVCLAGALYVAAGAQVIYNSSGTRRYVLDVERDLAYADFQDRRPEFVEARERVCKVIAANREVFIAMWNDDPERTPDDVVHILKLASEELQ